MFRFANPEMLYLFFAVPLLLLLWWWYVLAKRKDFRNFSNAAMHDQLAPDRSEGRALFKFAMLLLAYALLVLVLARPQFGFKKEVVKREGVEVIVALDVSNSMMATDVKPNRLEVAKQMISGLIDRMKNDKVGLIVFAGSAYTQLPITTDFISAKMFLRTLNPAVVPKQGTAIGDALGLAMRSFDPKGDAGRVVVVITDGENHEGDAEAKAQEAAEQGISVVTVGLGKPEGVPIPIGRGSNYLKDRSGEVVITKLNEEMLKEIADLGNGLYVKGSNNTRQTINAIYDDIDSMEKGEQESVMCENHEEQFYYLAALALLILFVDSFILGSKNKWFKRFRLFQDS